MNTSRRHFLKNAAALAAWWSMSGLSGKTLADYFNDTLNLTNGDLLTARRLLNYGYGGRLEDSTLTHIPSAIDDFYSAAYRLFSQSDNKSFSDIAANMEIQKICDRNGIVLTGGPMLGDLTSTGVKIWVRTFRPAEVKVCISTSNSRMEFGPVRSTPESDHVAVVSVTDLKPQATYSYQVLVNDSPVSIPDGASFTTAPAQGQTEKIRIAFGTCPHRWGLGNNELFNRIGSQHPAAMLLGGDTAVQDRDNNIAMHRADYLLRDLQPPWKRLCAQIPVYAMWDDHDYFNNDLAGIPKGFTDTDRQKVSGIFRNAWNNPVNTIPYGQYFSTRIGPCDIIMLDNRYFRYQPGDTYPFLGNVQMNWLESQLLNCKGPFIILSCSTMWSDEVSHGKDSWGKVDPKGRERIFNCIENNNIPGVLLISGDRHGARGFKIPRPSGYNFYEFEPASLGGRAGPPATNPKWKSQLFGYDNTFVFGQFDIDAARTDPQVTFRLIRQDGVVLYELTLKRSDLTPKK